MLVFHKASEPPGTTTERWFVKPTQQRVRKWGMPFRQQCSMEKG
jgi:hypothetical protein